MWVEIAEPLKQKILTYSHELIDKRFLEEMIMYPHVTLLHGLETEDVEKVASAIAPFHPIRIRFGITSIYTADDYHDYDVVKIDVLGLYLKRLRMRLINKLNVVPTYRNYYPHLTLAHVEALTAIRYIGDNPFYGHKYVTNRLVYLSPERKKYHIYSNGGIEQINAN